MTIGRIIATLIGCLILGVIAGLVTRNIIVAIAFPFLLVAFLLMWRNLKQTTPKEVVSEKEETQELSQSEITQQQEVETTSAPTSTTYPPRQGNPPTYN
jgi:choline-glycine betaine transporter